MYNNITLVGRWVADTEIRVANNGTEIMNGTLAVSDSFRKDHTDFIDVTAFKHLGLNTNKFTSKGSKVLVNGKLQQERWEKDGQKRSKHVVIANQIVFLDDKKESGGIPASEGTEIDMPDDSSLPF
ncbi:single-stranded DNA-binding protein [Virgibacillus sp. Bac332]|uniref:single-stranded DNA-binding protein n=1 Tax=Virgibacillus sp. Bac332 TaxID=2419842 RepID=UPI000EF52C38|nr:single-stranded DNA-binding protein [Virgibacillus sp. Bac332]